MGLLRKKQNSSSSTISRYSPLTYPATEVFLDLSPNRTRISITTQQSPAIAYEITLTDYSSYRDVPDLSSLAHYLGAKVHQTILDALIENSQLASLNGSPPYFPRSGTT